MSAIFKERFVEECWCLIYLFYRSLTPILKIFFSAFCLGISLVTFPNWDAGVCERQLLTRLWQCWKAYRNAFGWVGLQTPIGNIFTHTFPCHSILTLTKYWQPSALHSVQGEILHSPRINKKQETVNDMNTASLVRIDLFISAGRIKNVLVLATQYYMSSHIHSVKPQVRFHPLTMRTFWGISKIWEESARNIAA